FWPRSRASTRRVTYGAMIVVSTTGLNGQQMAIIVSGANTLSSHFSIWQASSMYQAALDSIRRCSCALLAIALRNANRSATAHEIASTVDTYGLDQGYSI